MHSGPDELWILPLPRRRSSPRNRFPRAKRNWSTYPARAILRLVEKKYPLDVVQRVRDERVQGKAKDLAVAGRRVGESKARADDRHRKKEAFELRCAQDLRAERAKLEEGQLSAVDLQRALGWIFGMDLGRAERARDLAKAEADLAQARQHAEEQRILLIKEQAGAEVVQRHRSHWEGARRAAMLEAEQRQAEEIHNARSSGATHAAAGRGPKRRAGDREGKP